MSIDFSLFCCPLLKVAPFRLKRPPHPDRLHSLGLHQLGLLRLLVAPLMRPHLLFFVLFDDFHPCVFQSFSNEHFKNGLGFQFEIEQVVVLVKYLNVFIVSFGIGDVNWSWGSIDVEVGFELSFISHIIVVFEVFPLLLLLHLVVHDLFFLLLLLLAHHSFFLPFDLKV